MKKSELKEMIKMALSQEGYKDGEDYNPDQEQLDDEDEIFMPMDDEGRPLEEKKKEMIRQARLAETEIVSEETVEEGVWSVLPARIPEFIKAVGALKDEYHGVVGSDDVFNGLDQAISAAEELLMNTANVNEAEGDEEEVADEIEVEDTETDTEMSSPELEGSNQEILNNLEAALEAAKQMGDEKLINQIGNTITFFTRAHIVKEEDLFETKRMKRLAGILK